MKKLLVIFSLMIPAWLYSCSGKDPGFTRVPAKDFEKAWEQSVEKLPEAPYVVLPSDPSIPLATKKPTPKHRHQVKRKSRPVAPPKKTEERLPPPQQGPVCIFPFNLVPQCTPGSNP